MIGTMLGRYRVLEKVGQGGMGVVYRGRDTHLARDVALKVLSEGVLADDEARRRFRNEALALSRLNHPNIAIVYDFDTQEGLDFLVLELITGTSLATALAQGPLASSETSKLGIQLAEGLAVAHEHGIIHRDIKPSNLFIVPHGRLKILDFGLARIIEEVTASITGGDRTPSQQVLGTLPYMAPEQLRGEPADFRSEIYAAGAVLYEMATGRRMVSETGLPALIEGVLQGASARPREVAPDVSPELESVIMKCVAKSPSRRYGSAAELRAALVEIAPHQATPADGQVAGPPKGVRRHLLGSALLALALVGLVGLGVRRIRLPPSAGPIRSIVVLPLENLSGQDQQYFADGMTDMLIMDLAQIHALRVISRTSAMSYRGTKKRLPEIAEELGVDAAVDGTVLRAGDRVRITVQLVDARQERALWASRYERDLVDVLTLQRDVASAVARNVEVALTSGERIRLDRELAVKPTAYEAYLKGRYFLGVRSPTAFDRAIDYLEIAVREDPNFAPAHAELANCFLGRGSIGFDVVNPAEAARQARASAEIAIGLDENSASAQTAMAHIRHNVDWDWPAAEEGFRRAIELNPGYPTAHQWYGFFLASRGRMEEAVGELETAVKIDPLSPVIHASLGRVLYYQRDYDGAASHFERALQIDERSLSALLVYGLVRVQQGRHEQALAVLENGREVSRGAPVFLAGIGVCRAAAGDRAAALEMVGALEELAQHRYVPAFYPSAVYAALDDASHALDWLERALEERSEAVLYLGVEPLVDNLRSEARFRRIVASVNGDGG